jgi:AcrR family transcriptional regulator
MAGCNLEAGKGAIMAESMQEVDPRIRRTRQLLQEAMEKLLEKKDFDKISVQDIAETATVNRVTFYDHYADKFALLECVVGSRFQKLLTQRDIRFDGTCSSALKAIVSCVCDFLGGTCGMDSDRQRQLEPYLQSAMIAVVRRIILDGLRRHPSPTPVSVEMIATTLSWSIYGAAQEWVRTPNRCEAEEIVGTITTLVLPILDQMHASAPAH